MPRKQAVSSKWQRILDRIPGYDPIATAQGATFDPELAQLALDFFPQCLFHIKGHLAGRPLELRPWQKAIVANLFGWIRPDGTRRYRETFIYVPRKNGKTTIAAGLAEFMFFADGEPGAEVYCAASDKDQARIAFEVIHHHVTTNPELAAVSKPYKDAIVIYENASRIQVLSKIASTKHGLNAHCVIGDEVHAHPNRDLLDVLMTSTGSRLQPLTILITTADYVRDSICNEKYEQAVRVRDGITKDAALLPVIYEASVDDDWTKVSTWKKANPNFRISITEDYLRRECQKALDIPAYENTFRRLHCNIRTEQDTRWIPLSLWDSCDADVTEDALEGQIAFAGLDLSSVHDLSAFVVVIPHDDGSFDVIPRFWAPEVGALRRDKTDNLNFSAWSRAGYVELTQGDVIDYDLIMDRIRELATRFEIEAIAFDPYSAQHLSNTLMAEGLPMVKFPQHIGNMNSPSCQIIKLLRSKQLRHAGHPVLRWNAANVTLETDSQSRIRPSKRKSTDRIDGIIALTMAIAMADQNPEARSVYETRGLYQPTPDSEPAP